MKKALFLLLISTPIKKYWPKKWWKNSVSIIFMLWTAMHWLKQTKLFKNRADLSKEWNLVIWPFRKVLVVRT
jgi:hypothetical protein